MPRPFPESEARCTSCISPKDATSSPRWTIAAVFPLPPSPPSTAAVCQALPQLLHSFPFRCIQTDNGSELSRTLSPLLRRLGIRHTRIRPRSPHLNGKVERVQRTLQEEHWDGVSPGPLQDWERGLQDYLRFYNRRRLHCALGYQTPMAYALQRLPRARLSHVS